MKSSVLLVPGLPRSDWTDAMPRNVCRNHHLSSWPPIQRGLVRTSFPFTLTALLSRHRPVYRARAHSSFLSLLILQFCLLVFLSRFATRLARAPAPFFLPFGERARNCPALCRPAACGDRENPGAADGVPMRTNVEGRELWRTPRTYTTCTEA